MTARTAPRVDTAIEQATGVIARGFQAYRTRTADITRRARTRFERRDWAGLHLDALERLDVFPEAIARALATLEGSLGPQHSDRYLWHAVREATRDRLVSRHDADLGATFYNSIVRRALGTIGADPYTELTGGLEGPGLTDRLTVNYPVTVSLGSTVRRLLTDLAWSAPWRNLPEDADAVTRHIDRHWGDHRPPPRLIELLPHVFYRGTRAFVVGRLVTESLAMPLTLALRHDDHIGVDAVLLTEDAVSIVFSFTRSYFHVDDTHPAAMVGFLRQIMPRKPTAELYTALGFFKHGKTLLYRDLARYIAGSEDCFIHAPGAKGMVMAAFTLPSVDVVFKVIRDEFAPPKTATRQDVMDRYALVFKHERAGRMVDAQEFEHLAFPRDRFAPALLDELRESCASMLHEYGDTVEIRHLYTERRLTPLDLYLPSVGRAAAHDAIIDYGQAIKDLAATNIFPGDLLLKNFGVTRHKRVVFYDYDELCPLEACRFRRLPPPRHPEDELGAEPWFHVGENDVFPEEFLTFLGLPADLKPVFLALHGDLLDVRFWRAVQARHAAGEVVDILPYRDTDRLRPLS